MKSVTYWYQFFTRWEELVPILHGVKFTKCAIYGSTELYTSEDSLLNPICMLVSDCISCNCCFMSVTISSIQTKTYTIANSVDPDETARDEPSHQDLHCLSFEFGILNATVICTDDMAKIKDRRKCLIG